MAFSNPSVVGCSAAMLLLQRLSGACTAWVQLGSEVVEQSLAPGEVLRVHPGHVGMFEEQARFGITTIRGVSNIFLGGDGLFLPELTGQGRVWLQTLTLPIWLTRWRRIWA